jgi:predicted metal-dependent HD superfamily phosphohydrolase
MDHANIFKKTEQYVTRLFNEADTSKLIFHNLEHTEYVVDKAKEIAAHYQLNEKDMQVIFISAWFHDTGYLFVEADVHEKKSVELMRAFGAEAGLEESLIDEIGGCIMATARDMEPKGLLQQIMCDADTYNFGTKDFKKTNKLVYAEWKAINPHTDKESFTAGAIKMLEHHHYYTSYCIDLLTADKHKNMKKLQKKLEEKEKENMSELHSDVYDAPTAKKSKKEKDKQKQAVISEKAGTTKGMQTMLRLTSSNHIKLSDMADSKANILISVNAIIISVILSVLLRKLQTDPYLTIPTLIFLACTVITIVIAILATRPKVNLGTFNDDDVKNKRTNLLFFGNFHRMPLKEYEEAMKVMMQDADYLYSSMVQDIYHLGTVLGKKYRLIRLAYTIFMVGIVISVIAFALASFLYVPVESTSVPTNMSGSPF